MPALIRLGAAWPRDCSGAQVAMHLLVKQALAASAKRDLTAVLGRSC